MFWAFSTLSCDSTGSSQLSMVLIVGDYRITVISGDNLMAGALPGGYAAYRHADDGSDAQ